MLTLSFKSITDEIFALTALRKAVLPTTPSANPLDTVLTRDNLPALRVLIRQAFSRLVMRLFSYVTNASVDDGNPAANEPYDPSQPVPLQIDFGVYTAGLSDGGILVLRRYLEHIMARLVLYSVYLPIDTRRASEHMADADALVPVVNNLLASPNPSSLLISPAYY